MRILCSNDDGIHASGLACLVDIACQLSDDVWVVAPHEEQSGAARALTLHHPLRVRRYEDRRFSVSGTPTDAVMMGITQILGDDKKPDLVLSGVNNGQNIAEDISFSGTVAAALQGMTMGIPSIALSLVRTTRETAKWETPRAHGADIIRKLLKAGWDKDVVMNVNFPDCTPDEVTGAGVTSQGQRDALLLYTEQREDLRGGKYYWFGYKRKLSQPAQGSDLFAVQERQISITPLHLALTHHETVERLSKHF